MENYNKRIREEQYKKAKEINLKKGDHVMAKLHVPIGEANKLSPKYTGPYKIVEKDSGNKFRIKKIVSGEISIRHADDLKRTFLPDADQNEESGNEDDNDPEAREMDKNKDNNQLGEKHNEYKRKLRNYSRQINMIKDHYGENYALYWVNNEMINDEFYDYVNEMLEELGVDRNSFYR